VKLFTNAHTHTHTLSRARRRAVWRLLRQRCPQCKDSPAPPPGGFGHVTLRPASARYTRRQCVLSAVPSSSLHAAGPVFGRHVLCRWGLAGCTAYTLATQLADQMFLVRINRRAVVSTEPARGGGAVLALRATLAQKTPNCPAPSAAQCVCVCVVQKFHATTPLPTTHTKKSEA